MILYEFKNRKFSQNVNENKNEIINVLECILKINKFKSMIFEHFKPSSGFIFYSLIVLILIKNVRNLKIYLKILTNSIKDKMKFF